jgi:class 3 adenylate cyclase
LIPLICIFREERKLKEVLDMRIGVHSGKILSGLLGICKWQYDVWSRDVIIANSMEQAGKPG